MRRKEVVLRRVPCVNLLGIIEMKGIIMKTTAFKRTFGIVIMTALREKSGNMIPKPQYGRISVR